MAWMLVGRIARFVIYIAWTTTCYAQQRVNVRVVQMENGTMASIRPSPPSSTPSPRLHASPRSNLPIYPDVRPTPPLRPSPRSFSSPRPANAVATIPSLNKQQQQQVKRPHPLSAFRSPRLQSEIAQIEQRLSSCAHEMTPEDALLLLERILPSITSSSRSDVDADRVLCGLAAACWKSSTSFVALSRPRVNGSRVGSLHIDDRMLYSRLLRGTETAIRERLLVRRDLLTELHSTTAHTRELPRAISNRERDIEAETVGFVVRTARALHFPEDSEKEATTAASPPVNTSAPSSKPVPSSPFRSTLGVDVHNRLMELRRRRELRAWACNELRGTLNDLVTSSSDLKKQIAFVINDVKLEEAVTKQKSVQIEQLNALLAAQSSRANESNSGGVPTSPFPASSPRRQAVVSSSASSVRISPHSVASFISLTPVERLARAQEQHEKLLEAIEAKRAAVRARTEQVFDIRRVTRELENETGAERTAIQAFTEQIEHMERAYTPRPDWHELQTTTAVTTAVDRAGGRAKLRRSRRNSASSLTGGGSMNDSGGGEDDDETSEHRMKEILSSHWSTVDKVSAMADELALMRTRQHSGDAILAEQGKLDQLQREIVKTLQQLEVARARASGT